MKKTCTLVANVDGWRDFHNGKDYGVCAIRLARSLRANGGKCKDMDLVFWHPENNPPLKLITNELKRLNCKILCGKVPITNQETLTILDVGDMAKNARSFADATFCTLAACQLEFNTDYTLYLNVDSYVLGDFSDLFEEANTDLSLIPAQWSYEIFARKEDIPIMSEFYEDFGCTMNKNLKTISQVDKKECNLYFYTTAVMYKNGIGFGNKYEDAVRAVFSKIPKVERYHRVVALVQVPIGMVIQKHKLSYSEIPLSVMWNYGAHDHTMSGSPAIVHCQWSKFPGVQDEIWEV